MNDAQWTHDPETGEDLWVPAELPAAPTGCPSDPPTAVSVERDDDQPHFDPSASCMKRA